VEVTNVNAGAFFKNLAISAVEKMRDSSATTLTTERIMQRDIELTAKCGDSASPDDAAFFGPAQFLICSPPGHEVTVTARVVKANGSEVIASRDGLQAATQGSSTQLHIYVFEPNGFPLSSASKQVQDKVSGVGQVSARLTIPAVTGVVVCIACPGATVDVSLHGESGPILTVTHPEPLL